MKLTELHSTQGNFGFKIKLNLQLSSWIIHLRTYGEIGLLYHHNVCLWGKSPTKPSIVIHKSNMCHIH